MKPFILYFFCLCFCLQAKAQDKTIFYSIDRIQADTKTYAVKAQYNEDGTFTLKFCDLAPTCDSIPDLKKDINQTIFLSTVKELLKTKFLSGSDPNLTSLQEDRIKQLIQKTVDKLESFKSESQKTTELIDDLPAEYSGTIKMHKQVPIITKKIIDADDINYGGNLLFGAINTTKTTTPDAKAKTAKVTVSETNTLNVDKVYLSFFNNKASTILIEGRVTVDGEERDVNIVNNTFSIPLRYFNNYGSKNTFQVKDKSGNIIEYGFDYNDVLDYKSNDYYNFSLANSRLTVNKDTLSKPVVQRSFFDYFTAVIFSDVLAIDGDNSNSLINAQAKLLVPLNLRNSGKWSAFRQFTAEVNLSLYNGSEDNVRLIESKDNSLFSNFDLLKKNNLNGKLNVDLLSHEAKGYFSYISLGYNASFYRTSFKKTTTVIGAEDSEETTQLFALSHGPVITVEVRPQTNFGADISLSLENLSYNNGSEISNTNIEDLMLDTDLNHFVFKYNVVNVKADFYWLTNPKEGKKGGVFARIGAFYHTDNYNIYPQLMVGYATNLTSFVNRFKVK